MLRNVKLTSDTPSRSLSKLHRIKLDSCHAAADEKWIGIGGTNCSFIDATRSIDLYRASVNLILHTVVEGEFNLTIIIASTGETRSGRKEQNVEGHKFLLEKRKRIRHTRRYANIRTARRSFEYLGVSNFTVSSVIYENSSRCARKYANVDRKVKLQDIVGNILLQSSLWFIRIPRVVQRNARTRTAKQSLKIFRRAQFHNFLWFTRIPRVMQRDARTRTTKQNFKIFWSVRLHRFLHDL